MSAGRGHKQARAGQQNTVLKTRIARADRRVAAEPRFIKETPKLTLNVCVRAGEHAHELRASIGAPNGASIDMHGGRTFLNRGSPRTCGREGRRTASRRLLLAGLRWMPAKAAAGLAQIFPFNLDLQFSSEFQRDAIRLGQAKPRNIFTPSSVSPCARRRRRMHANLHLRTKPRARLLLSCRSRALPDHEAAYLGRLDLRTKQPDTITGRTSSRARDDHHAPLPNGIPTSGTVVAAEMRFSGTPNSLNAPR